MERQKNTRAMRVCNSSGVNCNMILSTSEAERIKRDMDDGMMPVKAQSVSSNCKSTGPSHGDKSDPIAIFHCGCERVTSESMVSGSSETSASDWLAPAPYVACLMKNFLKGYHIQGVHILCVSRDGRTIYVLQ